MLSLVLSLPFKTLSRKLWMKILSPGLWMPPIEDPLSQTLDGSSASQVRIMQGGPTLVDDCPNSCLF